MMHQWFNIISEWTAVTLLNGVWGGALLIALLWLGVKMTSRFKPVNASTRYQVWVTGLVLCTVLMAWQGAKSIPDKFTSDAAPVQFNNQPGSKEQSASAVASTSIEIDAVPMAMQEHAEMATELSATPATQRIQSLPAVRPEKDKWFDVVVPESAYSFSIQAPPLLFSQIIMIVWVFISLVLLSQLLLSGFLVYRLKREAKEAPGLVQRLANQWLKATRTTRKVEVGISTQVKSAVAAGYLHPMVLIPEKMLIALDDDEIEQVVIHELSHIRRFDDWTILLQQVLKALFFFHPGVWVLSVLMNQDREIACDDQVVSLVKSPKAYANCLAKLASLQISGYAPIAVAPATSSKKQLFVRVKSILNRKLSDSYRTSRPVYGLLFLAALCICLSITYLAPVVAFAEEDANAVAALPEAFVKELPVQPLISTTSPKPVIQEQMAVEEQEDVDPKSAKVTIFPNAQRDRVILTEARSMAPVVVKARKRTTSLRIRSGSKAVIESVQSKPVEIPTSVLSSPIKKATSLSDRSMIKWLQAVSRISTPGEKRALLIKASHQLPSTDAVHIAYLQAALSISSQSDKVEALLNLLIRSDLDVEATLRYIEAIRSLSSSGNRHTLMSTLLIEDERLFMTDERVRRAVENVIESVDKNLHYMALMGLFERTVQEIKKQK